MRRPQNTQAELCLPTSPVGGDIMLGLMRWFTFCVCVCGALGSESQDHESGSTINYAEVRARVAHSFPEKANEIADTISSAALIPLIIMNAAGAPAFEACPIRLRLELEAAHKENAAKRITKTARMADFMGVVLAEEY